MFYHRSVIIPRIDSSPRTLNKRQYSLEQNMRRMTLRFTVVKGRDVSAEVDLRVRVGVNRGGGGGVTGSRGYTPRQTCGGVI